MLLDPIAPAHCQEPMRLVSVPAERAAAGEAGPLEWRCRCGFRLDAGLVPLPFPGLQAVPEMYDDAVAA